MRHYLQKTEMIIIDNFEDKKLYKISPKKNHYFLVQTPKTIKKFNIYYKDELFEKVRLRNCSSGLKFDNDGDWFVEFIDSEKTHDRKSITIELILVE